MKLQLDHPVAIAMWDFSWLERRWPGAGYEDWDRALDELAERGYDAVRIDAFPHLCAADPRREWELIPCWNQSLWGSPALNRVRVQPALTEFIGKCAQRGIKVGLSAWWRQDRDNTRMHIVTARHHAAVWLKTLDHIASAGLLDHILYVDLSNEWPIPPWTPFFKNPKPYSASDWDSPRSLEWMGEAISGCREKYPQLHYCFSTTSNQKAYQTTRLDFFDLIEVHMWMSSLTDFYDRIGYNFETFTTVGFENVALRAEPLYRQNPEHWQWLLREIIQQAAAGSRAAGLPLVTTECWAIVDYKDWPLLDWGWVKELCQIGTMEAISTGRWIGIATSNFCGPQFAGMWRDVEWHQRLTCRIKSALVGTGLACAAGKH